MEISFLSLAVAIIGMQIVAYLALRPHKESKKPEPPAPPQTEAWIVKPVAPKPEAKPGKKKYSPGMTKWYK